MTKANGKDAYYFSHDSNARNDPKILSLRSVYGAEGYGIYWMIIEILRDQPEYRLPVTKFTYSTLAMQMQCDCPLVTAVLHDCCEEFVEERDDGSVSSLLVNDGRFLYSPSLCRRMSNVDALSRVRKEAAQARWQCKTSANARQLPGTCTPKKRKENESREKKSRENTDAEDGAAAAAVTEDSAAAADNSAAAAPDHSPAAAAAPASDPAWPQVAQAWDKAAAHSLTQAEQEQLLALVAEYGSERLLGAISTAVTRGNVRLDYIGGILRNTGGKRAGTGKNPPPTAKEAGKYAALERSPSPPAGARPWYFIALEQGEISEEELSWLMAAGDKGISREDFLRNRAQ